MENATKPHVRSSRLLDRSPALNRPAAILALLLLIDADAVAGVITRSALGGIGGVKCGAIRIAAVLAGGSGCVAGLDAAGIIPPGIAGKRHGDRQGQQAPGGKGK